MVERGETGGVRPKRKHPHSGRGAAMASQTAPAPANSSPIPAVTAAPPRPTAKIATPLTTTTSPTTAHSQTHALTEDNVRLRGVHAAP